MKVGDRVVDVNGDTGVVLVVDVSYRRVFVRFEVSDRRVWLDPADVMPA